MKYAITGSLGHISKPVVTALVAAGHEVTVITNSPDRVKEIQSLGASAAVGSVEDLLFLTQAFAGADAVYTMVPPKFDTAHWQAYIGQIGKNYAAAINNNKIKYVVNLSSIGAHMPSGAGPVSGLYKAEHALNALENVHIKHLRPGYFYLNLLNQTNLIKNAGIMGSNFSFSEKKFVLAHTDDIAAAIIPLLLQLDFKGQTVQYVASDEVSTDQLAAVLGKAIKKPDLKWVTFTDAQALEGGIQAGLTEEISKNYADMGHALQTGEMSAEYWQMHTPVAGKIKLEDFAKTFATVYNDAAATVAAH
ncbi:MAG: NAD(P)H-binding protein [Chitinophagaceae bacterium]